MKQIASSFLIGILINLFLLITPTYGASCWFQFTCNQSDPGKIEYCSDGKCTIQDGSTAASNAVAGLMSKKTIEVYVAETVKYFLGFTTLIAVIYFVYAGFQLMTSGGDEESAKKTRKIMIYVVAGIVLIWMSYWLVLIVINTLT